MSRFRTVETSDPTISTEGLVFATVKSAALRQRADITFWKAPGLPAGETAPLIVLLHGVYGSHWAWALKGAAHLTVARLIAEGALPPVVLAMPSDGLWGDGSGYVPHADQDFERWVIEEVPAAAAEITGTCDDATPFLLCGLSMGGFAALRLAGKYPRRIAAAAAHSAVTEVAQLDLLIAEKRSTWNMAETDTTVSAALLATAGPLPPLYFDCGRDDPFLADNRRLHDTLDDAGVAHVFREADGAHDWRYWTEAIERSLRFFGQHLRASAPNTPRRLS